ncbi:hypothetical protein AB4254_11940 [Vibrio breoganii]
MDIALYAAFGGLLILTIMGIVQNWQGALAIGAVITAVLLLTTYTAYIAGVVFVGTTYIKYSDLKNKGKSAIGEAVFTGVKYTMIIILVAEGISWLAGGIGGSTGSCGQASPQFC